MSISDRTDLASEGSKMVSYRKHHPSRRPRNNAKDQIIKLKKKQNKNIKYDKKVKLEHQDTLVRY